MKKCKVITGLVCWATTLSVGSVMVVMSSLPSFAEVPRVGASGCVANCDGPSLSPSPATSSSNEPYVPAGPTEEELEQERYEGWYNANEDGLDAYERGDYIRAIRYFEEALEFSPHNPAILENIDIARQAQAEAEREARLRAQAESARVKQAPKKTASIPAKGLKIKEVPSPLSTGSQTTQDKSKLKAADYKSPIKSEVAKEAVVESYKKASQDLTDKIEEQSFKITLKSFPGGNYVKSLYDKYKSMREEMESLNMNIFQYVMKGIRDGVIRSASPDLSDGGLSEEYEEGRKGIFGRTSEKVRGLLKKEIDPNSQ